MMLPHGLSLGDAPLLALKRIWALTQLAELLGAKGFENEIVVHNAFAVWCRQVLAPPPVAEKRRFSIDDVD
jgi:hypothetical protein